MEVIVPAIGAGAAITVALVGVIYANVNNVKLRNRQLKEMHYMKFIDAAQMLASRNLDKEALGQYAFRRNQIFIMGSTEVIKALLEYESIIEVKPNEHDFYLTRLIKMIRKDLALKNKKIPTIRWKKI